MRNARIIGLAASVMLAMTLGCAGESTQSFRLDAVLDGVEFKSGGVAATVENTVLSMSGTSRGQFLNLRVAVPAVPGTVSFSSDSLAISRGEIVSGITTWSTIYGGSGTVTFTKTVGEEISGTFSFTARLTPTQTGASARVITQGTFSARF